MSDIIHLLPDSVANKIAAGEVVQRPASVVKELVENAIDAGADEINVIVTDAGKTTIQIIDNGKGMSETDARLAFERHATSKIREADDLYALRTMGFRGEALASVAAVAEVELRTCLKGAELGTSIVMAGSKLISQEPIATPEGSNFIIKNLFYNVPARRKFLKANSTELNNIVTEMERVALVNPDITFTMHSNDREVMNLPKVPLRKRIMTMFGRKMDEQLLSVEAETSIIKVTGYVVKPEASRKKGAHQFFFVNGRYMRHPYFHKAVMEAYEHLIPAGEQISYFIYFDIDPANIDVNIHPTKTEIKFENEQGIWAILTAAVREALGKFNAVPTIDFDVEDKPDIPVFQEFPQVDMPRVDFDDSYNPFEEIGRNIAAPRYTNSSPKPHAENESSFSSFSPSPKVEQWEQLYAGIEKPIDDVEPMEGMMLSKLNFKEEKDVREDISANFFQYKKRIIVTTVKSGMMLVDQRRAHIRILFEDYLKRIQEHSCASQKVIFPEIIQLTTAEEQLLEEVGEPLNGAGFELTALGGGSYAINGVPSGTEKLNSIELVRNMIHSVQEKGANVKNDIFEILALSLAKSAAVDYGKELTTNEMSQLVGDLLALSTPNFTPDGLTVLTVLNNDDIDRMFK